MELSVLERIMLLDILPQQGDYTTLKIVRRLRESLSFDDAEHKEYKFRQEAGSVFWEKEGTKEIPIGEKAEGIIVETLKKLSDDKKLKQDQFTLYEKFVDNDRRTNENTSVEGG